MTSKRYLLLITAVFFIAFGFVMGAYFTPQASAPAVRINYNPGVDAVTRTVALSNPAIGTDTLGQIESTFAEIYQNVAPSVVSITVYQVNAQGAIPYGSGSGFIIDDNGYIATNMHVVDGADRIDVNFFDGTILQADFIAGDADSDLAVIRVDRPDEELVPVTFANSDTLEVGQMVLAIGNPFRQDWTLTSGIISALNRTIPGLDVFSIGGVIQTDAAINPGNSGGPLLNVRGEVIGVNSQILTGGRADPANSGVGFAIPSNLVMRVIPELIEKGRVDYSYLGINSEPEITLDLIEAYNLPNNIRGVIVSRVRSDGPAADSGLRSATADSVDVITAIDGVPVTGFNALIQYLSINTRPGDTVTLTVLRDGRYIDIPVTLGARPGR